MWQLLVTLISIGFVSGQTNCPGFANYQHDATLLDVRIINECTLPAAYFTLNKKLNYWKDRNVPYVEPEFFYGNSRGISEDFHPGEFWRVIHMKLKHLGPVGGAYMFIKPFAVITDLDLLKNIMIKDFHFFSNRVAYFNEKDDPLSAHVINLEGEPCKNMRNKISPIFASSKLKMMFDSLTEVCDKLLSVVETETVNKTNLEVGDILSRFVTDVIGSTEFGINCNFLEDKHSKFYEMALKDFASFSFLKRMVLGSFRDLGRRLHLITTDKEIGEFYTDVLRKTIKYRHENPHVQREDLISLLIKLKNSSGSDALTFNQIAAQTYVFSVAGIETSAAAITFCMFELAVNENIQRRARESIDLVMKNHESLNYEALNEMNYLQQCINECLRKYPPVPSVTRVANTDYPIANTNIIIEKGTSIVCPIYSIHSDPEIYPEPYKYDPDRFTSEEVKKRHQLSFLPFGEGPRSCMATRYANTLVKIALVKILTNFEFKLDCTKTKVPLKMAPEKLVFWPSEDVFIDFKRILKHK